MRILKSGRNIIVRIASVVFAVILWFHVTTNATFSYKLSLPIQYTSPSEDYIIASEKPDEILVSVSGRGRDLFTFFLLGLMQSNQRYALVKLAGLPAGTNKISIENSDIIFGMFTGIEIERILYPDNATFTIDIDRNVKQTVAVDTGSLSGFIVREGFCVTGKPNIEPEFVFLEGPENIINTLNTVKVSHLSGETISQKNNILKARLSIPRFVKVEPDEVEITFHVEPLITKSLTGIPLILDGFPRRNRPDFKPDTLAVQVHGPESLVSAVVPDSIRIAVQYHLYNERLALGDSLITPTVTFPKGITVNRIIPKVIRFSHN